jgi:hypothetical protein
MSIGDILDRGLKLLLARLPTFYAINLLVFLPQILVQLVQPVVEEAQVTPVSGLLGILLVVLLALILGPIGNAASLHVIAQEFIGQRAGMGDAFGFAFHRFGRLLGASFLAGVFIGLGMLLCLVPGILFAIWYIFVGQVVVVEGLKGDKALQRSKSLGEGFRARILGLGFLFLLLGVILITMTGFLERVLPSHELVTTATGLRAVVHYPNFVVNQLVTYLVNSLVQSYSAVCWTLLYFDLRIRKEGFDLELAAQQQAPTSS